MDMSGEDKDDCCEPFRELQKAFTPKTMMLHHKFFRYLKGFSWKEPSQTTNKDKKHKKCIRENNSPCGLWASLDNNLLHSIMMKVNIVDYFAVGAVCRSWRSVATSSRDAYMKQQKPLVVVKSKEAESGKWFLYNIFDGEDYKLLLPDHMQNKRILGLSCGYLITLDSKNGFWLVNLMTRHELRYPALPENKNYLHNFRSILFNSTRHSQVFMIVYSEGAKHVLVSQNGAESWKVYTITNATKGIADVKVFKKKIYVLSCDAHICVLNFSTSPVMKLCSGFIHMKNACTHLVIMDNRLCMRAIDFSTTFGMAFGKDTLHELDEKYMTWVEIKEMGDYSLFLDGANATMVDTGNWGAGNCICTLNSEFSNEWSLRILDHPITPTCAPVVWNSNHKFVACFWYFPYKSYAIDCVDD